MKDEQDKIIIKGKIIDGNTRCVHYHTQLDIIAIKFKCCNQYYPCFYCHQENVAHPPLRWKKTEFETKAIICGICSTEMTIAEYKASNFRCPSCKALFNPKCVNHDHLYFEQE